jgi:hypothetical protein
MVLLDGDKKIENLNEEEKLKFEIMKTIAISKGIDTNDSNMDVDFRSGSNFFRTASILLAKFDIKIKKRNEEVRFEKEPEVIKIKKRKEEEDKQ